MENVDYSFMQTGFNNLEGINKLSHSDKAVLISTIATYYEEAIKIAEGLVIYEKRKEITKDDIILALKVQALDRSGIWDKPEIKEKVQAGYREVYDELVTPKQVGYVDDDDDDDDDDDAYDYDVDMVSDQDNVDKLEESTYLLIRSAHDRWNDWNPTDELNCILKSAIDKTESKMTDVSI